jgi:hypothetical protein
MRTEYDQLKRKIYHGVCRPVVLSSLRERSHSGEAFKFGDGVTRTAYPGVLIESMDFEEIAAWLALRNSKALHPCPQCLVHRDDLHRLTCTYPDHTTASMVRALGDAPDGPKTAREEHFKKYGLHDFPVRLFCLCCFRCFGLFVLPAFPLGVCKLGPIQGGWVRRPPFLGRRGVWTSYVGCYQGISPGKSTCFYVQ